MKKGISLVLSTLMVVTMLQIIPVVAQNTPKSIPLNMLVADKSSCNIDLNTTFDGVNVAKISPDVSSSDKIYSNFNEIETSYIQPNIYKYIGIDYYYEVNENDIEDNISNNMQLRFYKTTSDSKLNSSGKIVSNKWSRAIFDLSTIENFYGSDEKYWNIEFYGWGYESSIYNKGNNAQGKLYINNITLYDSNPGEPSISSVQFSNTTMDIQCGYYEKIPDVNITGQNNPIKNYNLILTGHTSEDTYISDGNIYIGEEEQSSVIYITAQPVITDTINAVLTINIKESTNQSKFDENNITTRFGVTSDTHVSGSWNKERSSAKLAHTIDVFQKMAQSSGANLDAILVNGDLTDSIQSLANVNIYVNNYGSKAVQNYRETNCVAQALWGNSQKSNENTSNIGGGYGTGINDGVKFFYSLGNHDEGGEGKTSYSNELYDTVYSAEYFAAIICGWKFDISKNRTDYTTVKQDNSYRNYIKDLIDYNTNNNTKITSESFEKAYGVTLSSADEKFDKFYGFDLNYSSDNGLLYGNRHMTIGTGNNAIHFVAIEISATQSSVDFLKNICDQSVKENPSKPIFIITHYKISDKVPGFEDKKEFQTNFNNLKTVLSNYPQAIIWGGHSHISLFNDTAIDTTYGFTQIDSSTSSYTDNCYLTNMSCMGDGSSSLGTNYPYNISGKSNNAFGNGCYVEVDNNFNVRIKRVDLYRSYSSEYSKDSTLYSTSEFTDYANMSGNNATDKSVLIRNPWYLTDIGTDKSNLSNYTFTYKKSVNKAPILSESSNVDITLSKIYMNVDYCLNSEDDGLVNMYVFELYKKSDNTLIDRKYLTNNYYNYPNINNIPALSGTLNYSNLSSNTEYELKVYPVDEYNTVGTSKSFFVTTEKITGTPYSFSDGRTGYFVDTSENSNEEYEYQGVKYKVFVSFKDVLELNPDVIFFVNGSEDLITFTNITNPLEIIGLNRDHNELYYSKAITFDSNITLNNICLKKKDSGDTGLILRNIVLTLTDVKVTGYPLNIFNGDWKSNAISGKLIVNGDTGQIQNIYPGSNYNAAASVKGDIIIELNGGIYTTVGAYKTATTTPNANKINGNVFVTITSGKYTNVYTSPTNSNSCIKKNSVTRILGGDFSNAQIGNTKTTYVDGKEVFIVKKSILQNATYNNTPNAVLIKIPDNEGGIGKEIYDNNGYITKYNILPVSGKTAYINGKRVSTNEFVVNDGENYTLEYYNDDLNGDNSVNSLDLLYLKQVLLGIRNATNVDVNCDGSVDIRDLVKLNKIIKGIL